MRTVFGVRATTFLSVILAASAVVGSSCGGENPGFDADVKVEVLEQRPGFERTFLREDRDGEEREILVEVSYPTSGGTHPVLLVGGYRNQDRAVVADQINGWNLPMEGAVVVRVGFPHMNLGTGDIQYRDIENHPTDVRTVMGYVKAMEEKFGKTSDKPVWFGVSMGGITGLVSAMRPTNGVELSAVVSVSGFLPLESQGFKTPQWDLSGAPPVLLIASQTDQTVPYELTRETYEALEGAGADVKFFTRKDADHGDIDDCAELSWAVRAWVRGALGLEERKVVKPGACAEDGPLPGGTTGLGLGILAVG